MKRLVVGERLVGHLALGLVGPAPVVAGGAPSSNASVRMAMRSSLVPARHGAPR